MDVMNDLYKHLCLVLPNQYDFLSGELREMNHTNYLGNHLVQWNATAELNKAFYVHFSDFPIPKPWLISPEDLKANGTGPACPPSCEERTLWLSLYRTFHKGDEVLLSTQSFVFLNSQGDKSTVRPLKA